MEEMGQGKINPAFWSTKLVHSIYNGRKIPINSGVRTLWIKLEIQLSYETAQFSRKRGQTLTYFLCTAGTHPGS